MTPNQYMKWGSVRRSSIVKRYGSTVLGRDIWAVLACQIVDEGNELFAEKPSTIPPKFVEVWILGVNGDICAVSPPD